ncbi:hypothetical protein [Streptomyces sp. cmx-4-9]|uniref:hypothetical protein n=1 Tax=Streptomyces sp. cmx-4-9 TaxID=2790941 RepID=UPI00397E923C
MRQLAKVAWDNPSTVVGYEKLVLRRARSIAGLGGPLVVAASCLFIEPLRQAAFALILFSVGFIPWVPWAAVAFGRRHRVKAVLRAYPWQEFPCRYPPRPNGSPATIVIPFNENVTSVLRMVPFPVALAERENDHPDRIWFAGDPRFGGVVSPVGGHYPVRVVPHVPRREECGGEGFGLALRVGLVRESGKATRT